MSASDDSTLERIASGEGTMRDDRTLARELAAEVRRLRAECSDLHAAASVRVYVTDDVARIAEWAAADLLHLRAAVREWFDADAAAEEAADVAEHAWGGASDLARDALDKANVRRAAARTRLRALAAGKGDTRGRIFAAISVERQRQDSRWGEQNHPDVDRVLTGRDGGCTPARMAMEHLVARASVARQACEVAAARGQCTWAHILVEEVAELVEAATLAQQGRGLAADVDRELVQCAAVCVSWLEARARRRVIVRAGED